MTGVASRDLDDRLDEGPFSAHIQRKYKHTSSLSRRLSSEFEGKVSAHAATLDGFVECHDSDASEQVGRQACGGGLDGGCSVIL